MNKVMLVVFLALLSTKLVYAQPKYSTSTTIPFDLLNGAGPFPEDFYIKDKVRIRYRISNINRNVYTITFNSEATSQYMEKPPIFNIVTDIDLTKLNPAVAMAPAAAVGVGVVVVPVTPLNLLSSRSNTVEQSAIARYLALKLQVESLIGNLNNANQKLKRLNIYYKNLTLLLADGITPFNNLLDSKLSTTHSILTSDFSYADPSKVEGAMLPALSFGADTLLQNMEQDYQRMVQGHNQLKSAFGAVEQIATNVLKQLNTSLKIAKKADKPAIQTAIDNIPTEVLIEKLTAEGINEIINEIKAINSKVTELQQNGFAQTIATTYRKINSDSWEYISPSVKGHNDIVTINMNIAPKEAMLFSSNHSQFNGEYTGGVYGFKVNFSTGLFLLFGKDLFDRSYRLDTKDADPNNNVIVENETNQSIQPAVGALMHFYNKKPGAFSWGGNFGFSVSTQTRLNYHGGVSFLFGEDKRIILSLGAALTQVKRLSTNYQVGQTIPKTTELNPIPTENFYRGGGFLAITYNLSK